MIENSDSDSNCSNQLLHPVMSRVESFCVDVPELDTIKHIQKECKDLSLENQMYQRYMEKLDIKSLEESPSTLPRIRPRIGCRTSEAPDFAHSAKFLALTVKQKCEIAHYEQSEFKKDIRRLMYDSEESIGELQVILEKFRVVEHEFIRERKLFDAYVTTSLVDPKNPDAPSRAFLTFHRNYIKRLSQTVIKLFQDNDQCQRNRRKLYAQLSEARRDNDVIQPIDLEHLQLKCHVRQKMLLQLGVECINAKTLSNLCTHQYALHKAELDKALQDSCTLRSFIDRRKQMAKRIKLGIENLYPQLRLEVRTNKKLMAPIRNSDAPVIKDWVQQKTEDVDLAKKIAVSQRQLRIAELTLKRYKSLWARAKRASFV